jgi:TolA-binding protein
MTLAYLSLCLTQGAIILVAFLLYKQLLEDNKEILKLQQKQDPKYIKLGEANDKIKELESQIKKITKINKLLEMQLDMKHMDDALEGVNDA